MEFFKCMKEFTETKNYEGLYDMGLLIKSRVTFT